MGSSLGRSRGACRGRHQRLGRTAAVRGRSERWDDARPAATRLPLTRPADHPLCSRRALRARRRGGKEAALQQRWSAVWNGMVRYEEEADTSGNEPARRQGGGTSAEVYRRGGKEAALQQRCGAVWNGMVMHEEEADTLGNEPARRQGGGTSAEVYEEDGRAWWDDARPAATGVWLTPTRPADHPLKARRTLGERSKEGGAAAWRGVNAVTDIQEQSGAGRSGAAASRQRSARRCSRGGEEQRERRKRSSRLCSSLEMQQRRRGAAGAEEEEQSPLLFSGDAAEAARSSGSGGRGAVASALLCSASSITQEMQQRRRGAAEAGKQEQSPLLFSGLYAQHAWGALKTPNCGIRWCAAAAANGVRAGLLTPEAPLCVGALMMDGGVWVL
ncbi:unnamed protein product [Closterium sp. Naga37s-1]|nr:unnamed protein product [Closterium sp. Naga37s-1]